MTSREWLALLLRRWYVVLACALLTVFAAQAVRTAPTYWCSVSLVLIGPADDDAGNPLQDHGDTVAAAGLLVRDVSDQAHQRLPATPEATLYGEGVRDGVRVTLHNVGGQWQPSYPAARIDIEAVAPTVEEATARVEAQIGDLRASLARWHHEVAAGPETALRLERRPGGVGVREITPARTRMLGAVALLGLLLTALLARGSDLLLARRRPAGPPRGPDQGGAMRAAR